MIPWRSNSGLAEAPILDLSYLERLSGHLGAEVTSELLADGMLELADRLDQLHGFAEDGDLQVLRRLTHDIIGASGHMGLSALSQAAAAANRELHAPEPSGLVRIVRPLVDLRNASIDALGQYCRQRGMTRGD